MMAAQPCAVCGSVHEPTYVAGEKVYQGGVLVQKVPGEVNGVRGLLMMHQTVCATCMGELQMLADYRRQQEEADTLPDDEVGDVIGRLKQQHPDPP